VFVVYLCLDGMRTNIGLINTGYYVGTTFAVFLIASLSKSVPAALFTRLSTNDGWKFSIAVGVCMNVKGMIELVALNEGLTLNIISPRIFTMLVIMALLTTFLASPVIYLLYSKNREQEPAIVKEQETDTGIDIKPVLHHLDAISSSASNLLVESSSSPKSTIPYTEFNHVNGGHGAHSNTSTVDTNGRSPVYEVQLATTHAHTVNIQENEVHAHTTVAEP
jgi:hypothetical protein